MDAIENKKGEEVKICAAEVSAESRSGAQIMTCRSRGDPDALQCCVDFEGEARTQAR